MFMIPEVGLKTLVLAIDLKQHCNLLPSPTHHELGSTACLMIQQKSYQGLKISHICLHIFIPVLSIWTKVLETVQSTHWDQTEFTPTKIPDNRSNNQETAAVT